MVLTVVDSVVDRVVDLRVVGNFAFVVRLVVIFVVAVVRLVVGLVGCCGLGGHILSSLRIGLVFLHPGLIPAVPPTHRRIRFCRVTAGFAQFPFHALHSPQYAVISQISVSISGVFFGRLQKSSFP